MRDARKWGPFLYKNDCRGDDERGLEENGIRRMKRCHRQRERTVRCRPKLQGHGWCYFRPARIGSAGRAVKVVVIMPSTSSSAPVVVFQQPTQSLPAANVRQPKRRFGRCNRRRRQRHVSPSLVRSFLVIVLHPRACQPPRRRRISRWRSERMLRPVNRNCATG